MPISGVVITCRPAGKAGVLRALAAIPTVEVYGDDDRGNIVAVLETQSSEGMEKLIDCINKNSSVLHIGITYLNAEDEAEGMAPGESVAKPFGFRQPLAREQ